MKVRQRKSRTRGSEDLGYKAQEKFLMEVAKRTDVAQMVVEEVRPERRTQHLERLSK